jgi:nucleoside-diphosphate-sugar epimerase
MDAAILGCGYVGIELGRQLDAAGHDVLGVRRSEAGVAAIEDAGLDAVRADVTDAAALESVPDVDWLVFAASSGGRGADAAREIYVEGLRTVIETFGDRSSSPERLVYTSSTGVYGDHDGEWVDEETPIDPTTEKTEVLAEAERVALVEGAEYGLDGTVARYAGLYGPDRYRLQRYLDGPVTEGYLNMIHREDAAGAVCHLLLEDALRDDVLLVVDDEPVDKWEFADWLAAKCGRPEPPKQTTEERIAAGALSTPAKRRIRTSKRCSNDRLHRIGYELSYPTFRSGYRLAIQEFRDSER